LPVQGNSWPSGKAPLADEGGPGDPGLDVSRVWSLAPPPPRAEARGYLCEARLRRAVKDHLGKRATGSVTLPNGSFSDAVTHSRWSPISPPKEGFAKQSRGLQPAVSAAWGPTTDRAHLQPGSPGPASDARGTGALRSPVPGSSKHCASQITVHDSRTTFGLESENNRKERKGRKDPDFCCFSSSLRPSRPGAPCGFFSGLVR
jgi:hypothetical protein